MITLPWLLAAIAFLIDQLVMTGLVRREYEEHPEIWKEDGQPRPMFWFPRETVFGGWYPTYRSGRAYYGVTLRWTFITPEWIRRDQEARKLLLAHRALLVVAIISVLAPFIIAVASQNSF
jgi:hypothetical protein